MGNDVVKFVKSFTIIFFIAMICYTLGANAYIAANPTQLKAQGIVLEDTPQGVKWHRE